MDQPNFNWKQLGQNFDQVNQNTGGAASAINNIAQKVSSPVAYDARKSVIAQYPDMAARTGVGQDEIADAQEWNKQYNASQVEQTKQTLSSHPIAGNILSGEQGLVSGALLGAPEAAAKLTGDTRSQAE